MSKEQIMTTLRNLSIPAIVVRQWLHEWDYVHFSQTDELRRKPEPTFFVFSLPAQQLRKLADIYPRQANKPRAEDTAIQRIHDPKRSAEIRRFVHGGFPWSDLSDKQKQLEEYKDLRMPGWLPTAIIANILSEDVRKGDAQISPEDVIHIQMTGNSSAELLLPQGISNPSWHPRVAPIEIIDGQHRLRAFDDEESLSGTYELPIVAFYNLDVTWQAYLFYTINIKPKKINASLAFDLYPILRIQDWLEKSPTGPAIYRETRAQELTEVLWSHPDSPWYKRINMLGERGAGSVTQAAFIRTLMSSFVKRLEGRGISIGGLFGSELHHNQQDVLRWTRPQQAALLVLIWQSIAGAIKESTEFWALDLRKIAAVNPEDDKEDSSLDSAFTSKYSLLATDQGVRGLLQVTNDLCYVGADKLKLGKWEWDEVFEDDGINIESVSTALRELRRRPVSKFISTVAYELTKFDWRTSSTPNLNDRERRSQLVYRGSSGYKEIRRQLLYQLSESKDADVRSIVIEVIERLGYTK
jgi:DGQHR domain-containing protein